MISLMMNMKLMARRMKGGNISSGRPVRLAMSHKNDRRSMIFDAVVSGVLFDIISALKNYVSTHSRGLTNIRIHVTVRKDKLLPFSNRLIISWLCL